MERWQHFSRLLRALPVASIALYMSLESSDHGQHKHRESGNQYKLHW